MPALVLVVLVVLGWPCSAPRALAAQGVPAPRVGVGVSLGVFDDYPSHFAPEYCEEEGAGATARVRYGISRVLDLEGSVTATAGVGGTVCAIPLRTVPIDGETFARTVLDEGIRGTSFVATSFGAVLEPLRPSPVSPRLRAGFGRIWGKGLVNWFYGGGVRVGVGLGSVVLDAERWHFGYDVRRELLTFRDDGAHELQSTEILRQSPSPWLVSLGWEIDIG